MLTYILIALKCSVVAFVYVEVLTQPGHILHPLWRFLLWLLTKERTEVLPDNAPEEVRSMPGYQYHSIKRVTVKKSILLKPLGECLYCTTGQLTLWVIVVHDFVMPLLSAGVVHGMQKVCMIVFTISLSIILSLFTKKIYEKWSIL